MGDEVEEATGIRFNPELGETKVSSTDTGTVIKTRHYRRRFWEKFLWMALIVSAFFALATIISASVNNTGVLSTPTVIFLVFTLGLFLVFLLIIGIIGPEWCGVSCLKLLRECPGSFTEHCVSVPSARRSWFNCLSNVSDEY